MSVEAAPLTAARKKRGRWAIVAVGVLVVIAAIAGGMVLMRPSGSATSTLSTAQATKRTINVTVSGSGSAVAADSVTVNPQISGTVDELYVTLGQSVKTGAKLYTISSSDVQKSLLQAKASLLQAKQSVVNADSSYDQATSQLYSANTQKVQAQQAVDKLESEPTTATDHAYNLKIAKRQLTSAKKAVSSANLGVSSAELGQEAAEANLSSAEDSYSTAKTESDETVVTAPSDGVITALPLSVGSAVTAGTNSSSSSSGSGSSSSSGGSSSGSSSSGTSSSSSSSGSSITITDMNSLQVELSVSEVDIPKVAVGQTATVEFDAISGKSFTGTVKSILPNATTSSGVVNYTVYVKLDTVDAHVRTGMTATVDISTQSATNVVAVPSAAVKTTNGTKYVLVVGPNGTTTRKTVTVGVTDDTYTQIVSGVSEGTMVSTGSVSTGGSSSSSSSSSKSSNGGFLGGPGGGGPPAGGPGGN